MSLIENMGLVNKDKDRAIKQIPVNLLVENPDNFYIVGDVEELKNSIIAAGGVRQNLIVEPMNDGRYMIVSGHRRCKAVKELLKEQTVGIPDTVPCEISTDHYGNQLLLIDTNSTSRDLTAWERVEQYKQLNSLFKYGVMTNQINGRKRDAIAKTLHESTTNIARYSAISNNLRKYYADWMKSGKLGISAAYELSKLQPDQQKDFYEQHMDDDEITLKSIEDYIHPVPEETPAQEAAAQEEAAEQEERPETDEENPEDNSVDEQAEDHEKFSEEAAQAETSTKDEPITWDEYMELQKEYKKIMRDIMFKHRRIKNYVEMEKNGTYTQIQMINNMQLAASGMYKQLDQLLVLVDKMKVVRT